MSSSANKNRHRREVARYGHKRARQATRRVLGGGKAEVARPMNWGGSIEQPPLPDHPVAPARTAPKKKGCKRNGYGPHVIAPWPQEYRWKREYDPEKKCFVNVGMPFARWHPSYRCTKCHKGFYSVPRGSVREDVPSPGRRWSNNWENEVKDSHYDLYNIRCRLLGLACRCKRCNTNG